MHTRNEAYITKESYRKPSCAHLDKTHFLTTRSRTGIEGIYAVTPVPPIQKVGGHVPVNPMWLTSTFCTQERLTAVPYHVLQPQSSDIVHFLEILPTLESFFRWQQTSCLIGKLY